MKVYRIEHPKDNLGPYKSDFISAALDKMCTEHFSNKNLKDHPFPILDKLNLYKGTHDWICAFTTLGRLKKWFAGWLLQIQAEGFKIYEIDISETFVQKGKFQCLIARENINSIQEVNI